jgi:predicted RNA binding protein YcfA (HicA-like mRNA interferase family)
MPRGLNNWSFSSVKHFLGRYGFRLNHIEGSHYFYVGSYGSIIRQVCVPFHGAETIHPKTMKSIVRQSGIPQEEWIVGKK